MDYNIQKEKEEKEYLGSFPRHVFPLTHLFFAALAGRLRFFLQDIHALSRDGPPNQKRLVQIREKESGVPDSVSYCTAKWSCQRSSEREVLNQLHEPHVWKASCRAYQRRT